MSRPANVDRKLILITGGHGFIGSHVAHNLYNSKKFRVRIVDIIPEPLLFEGQLSHEFMLGDLGDPEICEGAVVGASIVLHFAANMGGMGTIHAQNEMRIYAENHNMTLNLLRACTSAESVVERFLFASSACVYPESLQSDLSAPPSLREDDVYHNATTESPPHPQGLYGLEKLATELLLSQVSGSGRGIQVRIARLHNVYGPGGSWYDGREKVPAALLRKALALKLAPSCGPAAGLKPTFEIWGNGAQQRTFLYIDDAVDGLLKLLYSDYSHPLNIGSDQPISIEDLAVLALKCAGVDARDVQFVTDDTRPVGVGARSSNNERVLLTLDWAPSISLEDGMQRTGAWIKREIEKQLGELEDPDAHAKWLANLHTSTVMDLAALDSHIKFAVLLPITSRGASSPFSCLENLENFATSVVETTWRDTRSTADSTKYSLTVYLAIDHDDDFLLAPEDLEDNRAAIILRSHGLRVSTICCNHPRGHVCWLWRDCARKAWCDGCTYMGLFGDDVSLLDEGWMRKVHAEFQSIATTRQLPLGMGCVAFTDVSFPGMPTFPVIHRRHMDIFEGEVVPESFINQDGDPFLFQLYRRWNASKMVDVRLSNSIGGSNGARYEKQHVEDWTFETLTNAVRRVEEHLQSHSPNATPTSRAVSLDIVIPCYRVDLDILSSILDLEHSSSLTVMFIIIIDNPISPYILHLESRYSHRPDVRIRVNRTNLGASASRNRGLAESSAEWAFFLDDDIVPDEQLLFKAEEAIRAHPSAAGFIGLSRFPPCTSVFQTAVHLACVTFFWGIAAVIAEDVPWGVTANLIARRDVPDGVRFDLRYPKTGGGEDIDFCRLKRDASLQRGGEGFIAAPSVVVTHPWWNGGVRSYWRFYMWAYGDGMLVARFPDLSYRDHAPNSAELLFAALVSSIVLAPFAAALHPARSFAVLYLLLAEWLSIVVANVLHDLFNNLFRHPERHRGLDSSVKGGSLFLVALVESTLVRMSSEMGRLRGMIDRREWSSLGKRFDWFAGREGVNPINEERRNSRERALLASIFAVWGMITWS